ncbi:MAG: LysM peptidoglycan-binding domain-containing protein [Elusimicrobiota bacterium]|nr:LysM peptidoglycan-binding domain-containing protein [Elusimicrobiota bacterium]
MRSIMKFLKFFILLLLYSLFSILYLTLSAQEKQEVILQEIDVKEGDTLWGVANYYLKDPRAWPEILKYNKLPSSDPGVILPGMKLKVPVLLVKEHLRPAYLVYLLNDVRYRRQKEVAWNKAKIDMELYNEDSLRTMANSRANVKFLTGEIVHLDENSFVILRPEKKREEVELFSGAVRASKAKILTETAVVEPKIDPKVKESDFKTKIKPDKTTLVEVYEGIVDVTAQGKTVTLTKGFGTEVKYLKPPSPPRALPPLPEFQLETVTPTEVKSTLSFDLKVPEIKKIYRTETTGEEAKTISAFELKKYHLQVSKDSEFKNIILDEIKDIKDKLAVELSKLNLADGRYYYRVSYIDDLGFESIFSPVRQFVLDSKPPVVELQIPAENEKFIDEFLHIKGKTEQNVSLTINDKSVLSDDAGNFSTAIMLKYGRNTIKILAKDTAGNTTTLERNVYRVNSGIKSERDREEKKWITTPTGISIAISTFLVIIGVLALIFR